MEERERERERGEANDTREFALSRASKYMYISYVLVCLHFIHTHSFTHHCPSMFFIASRQVTCMQPTSPASTSCVCVCLCDYLSFSAEMREMEQFFNNMYGM
jgi:hypothetical protein